MLKRINRSLSILRRIHRIFWTYLPAHRKFLYSKTVTPDFFQAFTVRLERLYVCSSSFQVTVKVIRLCWSRRKVHLTYYRPLEFFYSFRVIECRSPVVRNISCPSSPSQELLFTIGIWVGWADARTDDVSQNR